MARKKNRSRKRKKQVLKKRGVPSGVNFVIRLLPFLLAAALLGAGIKTGIMLFFDSDYFKVKTIKVAGQEAYSGVRSIISKMDSKKGSNIFSVDLKSSERYLKDNYPELKDIRIRRILPDTIEVFYKVRRPFCQVESGYFYLVSDDMVVLSGPEPSQHAGLTVISGVDISKKNLMPSHSGALKKAISLLKEIEESGFSRQHKVEKINVYDAGNPAIFIEDGTRIEIGEYSFKQRQKLLEEILSDLESKKRAAKVIDLRFEDAVVIPR